MTERHQQFELNKRHIDVHPSNMNLNLNPGLINLQAPFLVGGAMINQIEKNFD